MEYPTALQNGSEILDIPARLLGVRDLPDGAAQAVPKNLPMYVAPIRTGLKQTPFNVAETARGVPNTPSVPRYIWLMMR